MPSRRLLGCFENVKRNVRSHSCFGGETIKDLGQRAKAGAEFLIPRGYLIKKGGYSENHDIGKLCDKGYI